MVSGRRCASAGLQDATHARPAAPPRSLVLCAPLWCRANRPSLGRILSTPVSSSRIPSNWQKLLPGCFAVWAYQSTERRESSHSPHTLRHGRVQDAERATAPRDGLSPLAKQPTVIKGRGKREWKPSAAAGRRQTIWVHMYCVQGGPAPASRQRGRPATSEGSLLTATLPRRQPTPGLTIVQKPAARRCNARKCKSEWVCCWLSRTYVRFALQIRFIHVCPL